MEPESEIADLVQIFFYIGNTISDERKRRLMDLAYATAQDQLLHHTWGNMRRHTHAPSVILVTWHIYALSMLCCLISRWKCILTNHQSGLTFTKTTTANVRRVIDTEGWHATFAFKTKYQVKRFAHTTGHGYTIGKDNFTLRKTTQDLEKSDATPRGCLGPN